MCLILGKLDISLDSYNEALLSLNKREIAKFVEVYSIFETRQEV